MRINYNSTKRNDTFHWIISCRCIYWKRKAGKGKMVLVKFVNM